jgi:hypothetical protein
MKDNEVKIGNTKIGPDTVIQINLKTLFIVLGIIMSAFTTAWVNINNNIKESSQKSSKETEEVAKDIKAIKDQDLKELSRKVYEIDGKVGVIFYQKQEELIKERNIETNEHSVDNIRPIIPKSN